MDRANWTGRASAALALMIICGSALAQSTLQELKVTAADRAAAASLGRHFLSAVAKGSLPASSKLRTDVGETGGGGQGGLGSVQNPADLTYQGGNVIASATQHNLYLFPNGSVCTTPACWGNIPQFERDLSHSAMMHITDQYVGSNDDSRYPTARTQFAYHYTLPANPLVDADMAALAHAVESILGVSGYGHIVHIFLAPEQNECFDTTYTVCSSNVFCAYHSSAVFSDIGEVVYTVEPYLPGVFGCNQPASSPNGVFDAQYSVLSHETFETVTDPDGSAWWNASNQPLFGNEIGDECSFLEFDATGRFVSFGAPVETLGERAYEIQSEYNNASHSCTTRP